MTIREMLETMRNKTIVEIREDNYNVITFESDGYEVIAEDLLNIEVYDWGIDKDRIFINYKSEYIEKEV